MKQQVNELLQKEMTRQEFLTTLGFGLASLLGLSSVLKLLNGGLAHNKSSHGYGSSNYGI